WLLGFVEGEGTFGYKHLVPYFQIDQHKKNLFVLNAIESFLLGLPKELHNTLGNQSFNVHYALNKKTNVYSMSVVSIDTLYSYIVPYFQSMSFLTRKALDFHY
ncbi:homing endonuclease, partial [Trichophaea hybrida]